MYLVSIQGVHASGFKLSDSVKNELESMAKALFGHRYLFIYTKFRIDFIYESENDYNDLIIKLLCKSAGKEFNQIMINKFFKSNNSKDTLEGFFNRLIFLSNRITWLDQYVTELQTQIKLYPHNYFIEKLMACFIHIKKGAIPLKLQVIDSKNRNILLTEKFSVISKKLLDTYKSN